MYKNLKELFGTESPTVRLFKAKLEKLSEEEQTFYRRAAVSAAFLDWENLPARYQYFLTCLFARDWQKTLDFLLHSTVMGSLRFEPIEPETLQQVVTFVEGRRDDGYIPSYMHLAFVYMLAFKTNCSLKYFSKLLRVNKLEVDDFWYLLEQIRIDNEPGHVRKD